jgi:hypothetical protein
VTALKKNVIRVLVALVFVALILAALPYMLKPALTAAPNSCVENLKLIHKSKQLWAKTRNKTAAETPLFADLINLGGDLRQPPVCPTGGSYVIGTVAEVPLCTSGFASHHLPAP